MLLITLVVLTGLFVSHLFRIIILSKKVFEKNLQSQLVTLLVLLLTGSAVQTVFQIICSYFVDAGDEEAKLRFTIVLVYYINWLLIYLVWLMLYAFYQYIQKQRSKVIQDLKLKALGNEIELSNLRSQLNPHFMFNSMNSIRALVDENPQNAKLAITKLSSILRSALQFGKRNFIDFKEEIEFVKDYLFLEKIRFEERLNFNFQIDDQLMSLKFPPLMLQTIVENSIKHGISTLPEGGSISVEAFTKNKYCIITVKNTGRINANLVESGIGLPNTAKRLKLLYGEEAAIQLQEQNNEVICEIKLPLKHHL